MNPTDKAKASAVPTVKKANGKDVVSDVCVPTVKKANGKDVVSDVCVDKPRGQNAVSSAKGQKLMSSAIAAARNHRTVRAPVSSAEVLSFREVSLGVQEGEVRFRLIHFWEAKNVITKTLIGLELLLIDAQGVVMQGFIPASRIATYLPQLKVGSLYRLNKFFGSNTKVNYRVADPSVVMSFTWNYVLSVLEDSEVVYPEDRFRFQTYADFDAACDLKGDLFDFVGHIRLVGGQALGEGVVLDEAEIASTRRIMLHVQTHDDPVMKIYLWDQAAAEFCTKFKAHGSTPRVILVTTVNPKRFGGVVCLASMTSSRVFLDFDVQPTRDYVTWLESNLEVANSVDATVVTKTESATISEILTYMKQDSAKVAWFECTATIDDVVHGAPWYYIGCGDCHSKATKGPTTHMCKKCGKNEVIGVAQYLAKLSVYDSNDQAVFVLLGSAGEELTGKKASELVASYFEANESVGDEDFVPVPQALIGAIGQTHKFIVKVSNHNLTGKTQTLTVTKVLPFVAPPPEAALEEEVPPNVEATLELDDGEHGPMAERVKRTSSSVEAEVQKRAKSG